MIDDVVMEERIDRLRRRVAWQVSTAYGLPLEDVRVPDVPTPVLPLPAPEPEPPSEPEPAPPPPPAAAVSPTVLPTLEDLERVVAACRQEDRAEELRWYLFYLRDHAGIDGTLPDAFGLLVDTVFGPLLQAAA